MRFAEIAEGYTRAQLEHADKEDEVLLPLAEDLLDDATQADLDLRCAAIDAELSLGTRGELLRAIEAIARGHGSCGRALPFEES